MHALKSIAPILAIVAFVGLSVLAFLLFQQARDIRRLREWAGRAPERAQEAADAAQAAADASRGEREDAEEPPAEDGESEGLADRARRLRAAAAARLREVDRRLPIDGRLLLGALAVIAIAAAVLTSGFGLVGGGGGASGKHRGQKADRPKVAVLNGTSVANLAARVDRDVVKAVGYRSSDVTNSPSSFATTVVMYAPGRRSDAKSLATAIKPKLGQTPTQPMTPDVSSRSRGAPLAL